MVILLSASTPRLTRPKAMLSGANVTSSDLLACIHRRTSSQRGWSKVTLIVIVLEPKNRLVSIVAAMAVSCPGCRYICIARAEEHTLHDTRTLAMRTGCFVLFT